MSCRLVIIDGGLTIIIGTHMSPKTKYSPMFSQHFSVLITIIMICCPVAVGS